MLCCTSKQLANNSVIIKKLIGIVRDQFHQLGRKGVIYMSKNSIGAGIGIGNIIAIVVSWSVNHSILWALIHGILGWLYIVYYVLIVR